jgi:Coenzyme PQQ synthesis protein D (PqqD)
MVPVACTKSALSRGVVFAELDAEAILLNTSTGIYFGLDSVGTRIWTLLGQNLSDEQIHAQLIEEYDVDADELRTDLARLLEQLEAHGLITRSTSV